MSNDKKLKNDLIELRTSYVFEIQFESKTLKTLEQYWCWAMDMFPKIFEKALCVLMPFATTYLSESGFNTLMSIKSKPQKLFIHNEIFQLKLLKTRLHFLS